MHGAGLLAGVTAFLHGAFSTDDERGAGPLAGFATFLCGIYSSTTCEVLVCLQVGVTAFIRGTTCLVVICIHSCMLPLFVRGINM